MPWHVAPPIRAIEEYREASGLYKALDSKGVTIQKAKETAGTPKVVPVAYKNVYKDVLYTAR